MSRNGTESSNQRNLEPTIPHHSNEVGVSEVLALVFLSASGTAIPERARELGQFMGTTVCSSGQHILKVGHFTKEGTCCNNDESDSKSPDETAQDTQDFMSK